MRNVAEARESMARRCSVDRWANVIGEGAAPGVRWLMQAAHAFYVTGKDPL